DFVERFVYISSSMIYGDFQEIPAPEDHPKRPKDIYGGTKYAGEIMTETYSRRYGIPYSIVRPSAVYGPYDIN
ncbi:MAG: NAD-dependent epimerase/dehydratase family protein, partial [Anaerolineales bacterium]